MQAKRVGIVLGIMTLLLLQFNATQALEITGFPSESDTQAVAVEDISGWSISKVINQTKWDRVKVGELETPSSQKFCPKFGVNGCDLSSSDVLRVASLIPVCGAIIENCIESLSFIDSNGAKKTAAFNRYIEGVNFPGDPARGLPNSATASLWNVPDAPNSSGETTYLVAAEINWESVNNVTRMYGFTLDVTPYKTVKDAKYKTTSIWAGVTPSGKYESVTDNGEPGDADLCAATDTAFCAFKVNFGNERRLQVKLKLSNQITGWLHGRISKPDISVEKIDSIYNSLTIQADAVDVPMGYGTFKQSQASSDMLNTFKNRWTVRHGLAYGGAWYYFDAQRPNGMEMVNHLAPLVNNTAAEVKTYWKLNSISVNPQNKCLSDTSRLLGFVTTNAMAYSGEAPEWDGSQLKYSLAGMHYLPGGKDLALGKYDLTMRSDAARCLYGFTNAPIKASISVQDAEGSRNIATTVLNEKDGWLYLGAYGFTFSSPTIAVKLSQELPQQAKPTPAPISTTPSTVETVIKKPVSKLLTITCVKGKVSKRVTAVSPKCPAGYKKK